MNFKNTIITKSIFTLKKYGLKYYIKLLFKILFNSIFIHISYLYYRFTSNYKNGINIFGYFRYSFGNAEASRSFVNIFLETGIPLCLINLEDRSHTKIDEKEISHFNKYFNTYPKYYRNISLINAFEFKEIFYHKQYFRKKYNISVIWWEFESGLENILGELNNIQEIIVFSDFIKKTLLDLNLKNIKITKLLYPFILDHFVHNLDSTLNRREICNKYLISDKDYIFLFTFDYLSSYNRKNPEHILQAFANLPHSTMSARLIIKSINGYKFPEKVQTLNDAIKMYKLDKTVILEDTPFSRKKIISLLDSADCYISLHRGEGLGLGMLESMALGKPVIASRYGGNLEFMNDENSILIDCNLIPAKDDYSVYKDVKYWAEPDIEQASEKMFMLYNDREYSRNLGLKAKKSIEEYFTVEKILDSMKLLLK